MKGEEFICILSISLYSAVCHKHFKRKQCCLSTGSLYPCVRQDPILSPG